MLKFNIMLILCTISNGTKKKQMAGKDMSRGAQKIRTRILSMGLGLTELMYIYHCNK